MTSPRDGVLVTARARTDLGRTRDHNEDAFLVADLTTRTTDLTNGGPHRVGERGSLFLVADGMGGAAAGELASSMAADSPASPPPTTATSHSALPCKGAKGRGRCTVAA